MTPPSFGNSACSSLTQTTFWLFTHTHIYHTQRR